jgi:hypothetical protein
VGGSVVVVGGSVVVVGGSVVVVGGSVVVVGGSVVVVGGSVVVSEPPPQEPIRAKQMRIEIFFISKDHFFFLYIQLEKKKLINGKATPKSGCFPD